MFYDYQEVIVCMLLLPVALNIVLPLVMLVVWFLKQLVLANKKQEETVHAGEKSRNPQPTA